MSVTACLLSWRRTYNIPEIVENLLRFDEVSEIVVWQNEFESSGITSECYDYIRDRATLVLSKENHGVFGRFLAAKHAKNDTVFFQDDDLLVRNLPNLVDLHRSTGKVIANLANDESSRHWNWWQANRPEYIELGFGSVASKESIRILDNWPYDEYLLKRKADKIFTIANEWEAVYAGSGQITRLYRGGKECGRDENALFLRDDHKDLTNSAVASALEWRRNGYGLQSDQEHC